MKEKINHLEQLGIELTHSLNLRPKGKFYNTDRGPKKITGVALIVVDLVRKYHKKTTFKG